MFAVGAVVASSPAVAAAAPDAETESSTGAETDSEAATKPEADESEAESTDVESDAGSDTSEDVTDEPTDEPTDDADAVTDEDVPAETTEADSTEPTEEPEPEVTSKRRSRDEPAKSEEPGSEADTEAADPEPEEADPATPEPSTSESTAATTGVAVTTADQTEAVPTSRPVTTKTIIADVMTWVGLGDGADDVPIPALPVPKIFEMMWLAVRQTQSSWNNQRPVAQPTLTAQGDDGVVLGDLNATDFDDATLTYVVSAPAKFGTVVVDANGAFTYTPKPGVAVTTDTFTVTIDDAQGNPPRLHGLAELFGRSGPTTATITVDVAGGTKINDTAVTRPGAVTVQMGSDGKISVIGGTFTGTKVSDKAAAAAVLNSFATVLGAETGFATEDSITVHRVGGSGVTEEFYRLRQTVDGIEVIGGDVILVTDGNGTVTGLFNYNDSRIDDVNTTPDLAGGSTVAALAAAHLIGSTGVRPSRTVTRLLTTDVDDPELVILAYDDEAPSLAWRVELPVATYYIRANGENAGEVISATSTAQPATTVGRDLLGVDREINVEPSKWWYLFDSEGLNDVTRSIETYATGYTFFGLGTPYLPGGISTRSLIFGWNAGGVSAHANMAEVYDYYAAVLGRDSFDGEGATVVTSVGFNPRNDLFQYFFGYTNANWDAAGQQFLFGNTGGFEGALDIVAHEFTHGVVSHVVGDGGSVLDHGESGALNEAYSDILGNLIEGKTGTGRWLVGEDTNGGAIRSMANPTAISGYRATYATRYIGTDDDSGEHWNSTIFSNAAYRMMTDSDTAGVSGDTWAKVFYQSLYRLDEGAKFTDGRTAVLDAADENGFTDSQLQAIEDAFDAVGIAGTTTLSGPEALALVAL
jgi:bacillolysin